jgi:hypothetical protein
MISSVSACIRPWSSNGSWRGQRATSSRVSCAMSSTVRATRSPWKAGSIRLRSARCSSSSSSSTERRPRIGPEDLVALARVEDRGGALEDLLDHQRVGDVDRGADGA